MYQAGNRVPNRKVCQAGYSMPSRQQCAKQATVWKYESRTCHLDNKRLRAGIWLVYSYLWLSASADPEGMTHNLLGKR